MSTIINLLLFVLILGVIVFIHEFGHFTWAKITGVYVYEFSLGMGPKIWGFKKGETEYNIRAIPIGGFCQLAGEDLDDDDLKKVPKDRRLQSKTAFQRFLIMVFGPMNNFILAVVLILFIGLIWGGNTMDPVLTSIDEGSPAEKAGLEAGDTVVKINGHKISSSDDVIVYLSISNPKKNSTIVVEKKSGETVTCKVKPEEIEVDGAKSYKYGVGIEQVKTHGFVAAFRYTFQKTRSIFKQMFITVGYLFSGNLKLNQLSGPVGIYSLVGEQRSAGIANLIYLTAYLSINVGFMNLLPIPALDGGHILFIIIEKIKGSPVKPEVENKIHTIFYLLLLLLIFVVMVNDILRLF